MSGYCLECGNDLCICSELEEEAKKQPDVVFICQRKEIEKLQEQNKILREALEFYALVRNWKYPTQSDLDRSEFSIDDEEFIMGEGHVYGKLAREALAKVKE